MKDLVILPTCGRRPEFLWLCAEYISACNPTDKEFWICVDVHQPSHDFDLALSHAIHLLKATVIRRTIRKNSYDNIWSALEDANQTDFRLIYFLEDDIFITSDMFRWSEQVHEQFDPFIVCADNPWVERSNDPTAVGLTHSLFEPRAASIRRENLSQVLKRDHKYTSHPEVTIQNYIIRTKKTMIWPLLDRAVDCGWYGENKSGSLTGTLQDKISIVRKALIDSSISNNFIREFKNPPEWHGSFHVGFDHRKEWESQYEAQSRWGF